MRSVRKENFRNIEGNEGIPLYIGSWPRYMKRHKPIKKWHVAFTSKKLIDTTSDQLNCDTWHLKKKKFHLITPSHERPLWTRGQLMVYQKCMSRFIQKGRSWEGIEEIRREKRARRQLPRPSLIKDGWAYWILKDGWAYWILQAWSMLVLSYLVRPW